MWVHGSEKQIWVAIDGFYKHIDTYAMPKKNSGQEMKFETMKLNALVLLGESNIAVKQCKNVGANFSTNAVDMITIV